MTGASSSPLQSLALDAERAGAAMGCRYLSADEYEAALIAERRAAGIYGKPRRNRVLLWGVVIAAVLVYAVI